jgi:hypothetical protein
MEHRGFSLIEQIRVGDRCFVLGRHNTVKDIYVVWEKGTPWIATARHFDDERRAMIELDARVRDAEVQLAERLEKVKKTNIWIKEN